jgi:hypothetical protein
MSPAVVAGLSVRDGTLILWDWPLSKKGPLCVLCGWFVVFDHVLN